MVRHTARTRIDASPEQVWEVVADSSRLAEWLSPVKGVDGVTPEGPLTKGTKVEATLGNVGGATLKIKKADHGQRLKWSAGPFLAHMMRMPMQVELNLEGRGERTMPRIVFKTNPMIAPIMGRMTGLEFAEEAFATVRDLKAAVERG